MLNTTAAPLFFLLSQLVVAVVLFLGAHAVGLIQIPLHIELEVCKGLIPMVGLSVIGLSLSNYTLKYVDASFYQVARGLVLPFTVCTSYFLLAARPSLHILVACAFVTLGFFVGVFLDAIPISLIGVSLGVLSSGITALHSVVIKKALGVVGGSALHLSWYTNLLSVGALIPVIVLMGEGPEVVKLFAARDGADAGAFGTFMWGSLITVRRSCPPVPSYANYWILTHRA